jgi:hypothetical protein
MEAHLLVLPEFNCFHSFFLSVPYTEITVSVQLNYYVLLVFQASLFVENIWTKCGCSILDELHVFDFTGHMAAGQILHNVENNLRAWRAILYYCVLPC